MDRQVERYWNGNWGRLARRDLWLRHLSDGQWQVELRRGGAEGRSRTWTYAGEDEAREQLRIQLADAAIQWQPVDVSSF